MKITAITLQQKNKNRVNIFVDGSYKFSLDVFQVAQLGIYKDKEYSSSEINAFETESEFGKVYARALEYCLLRPHSSREVKDYLFRKTRDAKKRNRKTGEISTQEGISESLASRVYDRLEQKKYIDDEKFARFWVENRNTTKGMSHRKLQFELQSKGVSQQIINECLTETDRSDQVEIKKIIAKKAKKYSDTQKLMQYLARQGFTYDDIKNAIESIGDHS